jgi:predicted ABC-type ATPase
MNPPVLWIVGGPNGAGKTSCVQKKPISLIIPGISFLNPDDRTLAKLRAAGYSGFTDSPADILPRLFRESADEVAAELSESVERGIPIGVESVISTDKYKSTVDRVHELNGEFFLIYVALATPDLALRRIADRVARGGHGVPETKVADRWRRSLDNLEWFTTRADAFWIVDNSASYPNDDPRLVAFGRKGTMTVLERDPFPEMNVILDRIAVQLVNRSSAS